MIRHIHFRGVISGDYECFVWAVTKETYVKVTGREPTEYEESDFHKDRYNLYPGDVLRRDRDGKEYEFIITMAE